MDFLLGLLSGILFSLILFTVIEVVGDNTFYDGFCIGKGLTYFSGDSKTITCKNTIGNNFIFDNPFTVKTALQGETYCNGSIDCNGKIKEARK